MSASAPLIAITGGIGAGKSVISRILRTLAYPVFDCDTEARILMGQNTGIKEAIRQRVCSDVLVNGEIDRRRLAEAVFTDTSKRLTLNAIVHSAVIERLLGWHSSHDTLSFVETALLYTSGLDKIVDAEWRVTAPEDIRISRVVHRNGLPAEEIRRRIASQSADENPQYPHPHIFDINNDGMTAVLPQLFQALETTASMRSPHESVKP